MAESRVPASPPQPKSPNPQASSADLNSPTDLESPAAIPSPAFRETLDDHNETLASSPHDPNLTVASTALPDDSNDPPTFMTSSDDADGLSAQTSSTHAPNKPSVVITSQGDLNDSSAWTNVPHNDVKDSSPSRTAESADVEEDNLSNGSEVDFVYDANTNQEGSMAPVGFDHLAENDDDDDDDDGLFDDQAMYRPQSKASTRPKSSRRRSPASPANNNNNSPTTATTSPDKTSPNTFTSSTENTPTDQLPPWFQAETTLTTNTTDPTPPVFQGENVFSEELQRAMSALEAYQHKLKNPTSGGGAGGGGGGGGSPGVDEAADLRQTLERMTRLCETCSSTSASLGQQLTAARQLTDSIGQDLTAKLQATDLKDWIPPGYFSAESDALTEEQRRAGERERLARAADARAAVARANHVIQERARDLARAEAAMAEAQLAAEEAKEQAEEAVQQLEATRAAEEAATAREEEEGGEKEEDMVWKGEKGESLSKPDESGEGEVDVTAAAAEMAEDPARQNQEEKPAGSDDGEPENTNPEQQPYDDDEQGSGELRQVNPKAETSLTPDTESPQHTQQIPSIQEEQEEEEADERQQCRIEGSQQAQEENAQDTEELQNTGEPTSDDHLHEDAGEDMQVDDPQGGHADETASAALDHPDAHVVSDEEQNEQHEAEAEERDNEVFVTEAEKADVQPEEEEVTSQRVFAESGLEEGVMENVHLADERQTSVTVEENGVDFEPEELPVGDDWPRYIYSLEAGDWDTGLGCVVRAPATSLARDDLEVTRVLPAVADLRLSDSEELISNIVQIAPYSRTAGRRAKFSTSLAVSLPHCAPRMHPGREPAVRLRPLGGGHWRDLSSAEVYIEDIREHKFVEARVAEAGTLCVVLRLKREEAQLTRYGGSVMASADSRVTLSWPPNVVKTTADLTMAVQLLDQAVVTDLRGRSDAGCAQLMTCSPMVHLQWQGRPLSLQKPLTLAIPCPPNPATARPQRPASSMPRRPERMDGGGGGGGGGERPATARPFFTTPEKPEEVYEDEVHVLCRSKQGAWTLLPDTRFQQAKKKDVVVFQLPQPHPRVLLLRTRAGLPSATVERLASTLDYVLGHHALHLVLRQHSHDPAQVLLTYSPQPALERCLKDLAQEGFVHGPPPSGEVKLREGQMLELKFRGNILPLDNGSHGSGGGGFMPRCVFHANIPFRVAFCAAEVDRFAQKGFESYRGFVQLSATYTAPFRRSMSSSSGLSVTTAAATATAAQANGKPAPPTCFVSGTHLLAELTVSLPKPEAEPPKPLNTAPVLLKSYGPVTDELLRYVSQQLAADDWQRLCPVLHVRRTRLQAILRQNVATPPWLPVYHVLLTWSKRLPLAFDRVEVLCAALTAIGRHDLVDEVRDKENTFRDVHFFTTREALLNKAFVRIARHDKAVSQWRRLALFLGLSEEDVQDINRDALSARERCIRSLRRWKGIQDSSEDLATVTLLSRKLRLCRYRSLARDLESIR